MQGHVEVVENWVLQLVRGGVVYGKIKRCWILLCSVFFCIFENANMLLMCVYLSDLFIFIV